MNTDTDFDYSEIRVKLEEAGTPIGPNDLLIAAHARSLDLILVSANIREFTCVPGLSVENWLDQTYFHALFLLDAEMEDGWVRRRYQWQPSWLQ